MSISINWQPIVGGLLLIAGAVAAGLQWWQSRPAGQQASQTGKPEKTSDKRKRAADEPAPPGAVDWVEDICGVIQGAPDSLILSVLKKGGSRESALIAERETRKPTEPTA